MVRVIKRALRWVVFGSWPGRFALRLGRNARGMLARRGLPAGSYIAPSAQVLGWRQLRIGRNSVVGERTWINVNHRSTNEKSMVIGNHCFIGRDNFFSAAKKIELGDYVLTTQGCRFVSAAHVYSDPLQPYISTGTTTTDSIIVGANCFFGIGATVVGNVRIGHGSVIGAGAFVRESVPPFSLVVGNPARVIKRYDFRVQKWVGAETFDAHDALPDEKHYLEMLRKTCASPDMPVIAASRSEGEL